MDRHGAKIKTAPSHLCFKCVRDDFLRCMVEEKGEIRRCNYCGRKEIATSLDDISTRVQKAFSEHFIRTPTSPSPWERAMEGYGDTEEWARRGDPSAKAILEAGGLPEPAAKDIQKLLSSRHLNSEKHGKGEEWAFSSDAHYEQKEPDSKDWEEAWLQFEKLIGSEERFFSARASGKLRDLFDSVDGMRTQEGDSPVIAAGPGTDVTRLYRARVFDSQEQLEEAMRSPSSLLGPPPGMFAKAGRMNASGISVFYGATKRTTAMAEVRPPVGSHVAVACFRILRTIQLLDLAALGRLEEQGSIFDPGFADRLSRMVFLRKLSTRLSQPVMPSSEETEFLPTQVISDFLATECKTSLDGILYPSVQASGNDLNAVLFHKSAGNKEIDIEDGSYFVIHDPEIDDEIGPLPDYGLIQFDEESSKRPDYPPVFAGGRLPGDHWDMWSKADTRKTTVEIDLHSISVHTIKGINYVTRDFEASYSESLWR